MQVEILPRYPTSQEQHYVRGPFDLTEESAEQLKKDYKEYIEGLQKGTPAPQGGIYTHQKSEEKRTLFINFNDVLLMM